MKGYKPSPITVNPQQPAHSQQPGASKPASTKPQAPTISSAPEPAAEPSPSSSPPDEKGEKRCSKGFDQQSRRIEPNLNMSSVLGSTDLPNAGDLPAESHRAQPATRPGAL